MERSVSQERKMFCKRCQETLPVKDKLSLSLLSYIFLLACALWRWTWLPCLGPMLISLTATKTPRCTKCLLVSGKGHVCAALTGSAFWDICRSPCKWMDVIKFTMPGMFLAVLLEYIFVFTCRESWPEFQASYEKLLLNRELAHEKFMQEYHYSLVDWKGEIYSGWYIGNRRLGPPNHHLMCIDVMMDLRDPPRPDICIYSSAESWNDSVYPYIQDWQPGSYLKLSGRVIEANLSAPLIYLSDQWLFTKVISSIPYDQQYINKTSNATFLNKSPPTQP